MISHRELLKKLEEDHGIFRIDAVNLIKLCEQEDVIIASKVEKKRKDADGKVIHVPGTRAYHLMSACAVYSSDQHVIITFPCPSPDLAKLQLQGKLGKNLYQKAA